MRYDLGREKFFRDRHGIGKKSMRHLFVQWARYEKLGLDYSRERFT